MIPLTRFAEALDQLNEERMWRRAYRERCRQNVVFNIRRTKARICRAMKAQGRTYDEIAGVLGVGRTALDVIRHEPPRERDPRRAFGPKGRRRP